jgi:hypothetical protein
VHLKAERIKSLMRLPGHQVPQNRNGFLLKRPADRPPAFEDS